MDFLDAIILNGLKQTSLASLQGMWYQLSEATLSVSKSYAVCNSDCMNLQRMQLNSTNGELDFGYR